jgi:hypothetical protein
VLDHNYGVGAIGCSRASHNGGRLSWFELRKLRGTGFDLCDYVETGWRLLRISGAERIPIAGSSRKRGEVAICCERLRQDATSSIE